MALKNVTEEIDKVAAEKVKTINAEAAKEVACIEQETSEKIAQLKENMDKRIAETIDRLDRQETSSAELESKKIVLAKKKEILSTVFDETLAELSNMPAAEKLAQYKKMVAYAKTIIDDPKAIMSPKDSFSAADLGVSSVETNEKVESGLILQSKDGEMEVDMQYSALLRTVWDREITEVSDILFR